MSRNTNFEVVKSKTIASPAHSGLNYCAQGVNTNSSPVHQAPKIGPLAAQLTELAKDSNSWQYLAVSLVMCCSIFVYIYEYCVCNSEVTINHWLINDELFIYL